MGVTALLVAFFLSAAPPPLGVDVRPACEGRLADAELRRLLAIELHGEVLSAAEAPAEAQTIRVECGLGRTFHLTASGGMRTVTLETAAPRDVPRLLALAIAELTHPVPRRAATPPQVTYAPLPRPVPLAPPPPPVAIDTDRLHPEVLLGARVQRGNWLAGAGLGLGRGLRGIGQVVFETTFERARRATALGSVDADLWSTGLWGGLRGRWSAWTVEGGIGGRIGLAFLTGRPSSGGVLAGTLPGFWAGPSLAARVACHVAPGFAVVLRLEVGQGVSGVSGQIEGQRAVALEGTFGALALGVRL